MSSSTTSNAAGVAQYPHARGVAGGIRPSAVLPLLGDAPASPASRRLTSDPMAPATRPSGFLLPAVDISSHV